MQVGDAAADLQAPEAGLIEHPRGRPRLGGLDLAGLDLLVQLGSQRDRPPRLLVLLAVMAVERNCIACARAFDLARATLASLNIRLRRRLVRSDAAVRRRPLAFNLAILRSGAPYPDPAALIAHALNAAVPRAWLPRSMRATLHELGRLYGAGGAMTAARLTDRDAPIAPLGRPVLGQLYAPRIGCHGPTETGLNLAALCLTPEH